MPALKTLQQLVSANCWMCVVWRRARGLENWLLEQQRVQRDAPSNSWRDFWTHFYQHRVIWLCIFNRREEEEKTVKKSRQKGGEGGCLAMTISCIFMFDKSHVSSYKHNFFLSKHITCRNRKHEGGVHGLEVYSLGTLECIKWNKMNVIKIWIILHADTRVENISGYFNLKVPSK